jgi:dipeptidyl aminopeptidase/acylaminoacyl peptidase
MTRSRTKGLGAIRASLAVLSLIAGIAVIPAAAFGADPRLGELGRHLQPGDQVAGCSPDGKRVYFLNDRRQPAGLYSAGADAAPPVWITSVHEWWPPRGCFRVEGNPVSPDGSRLAIDTTNGEVGLVRLDTGAVAYVSPTIKAWWWDTYFGAWSPSGDRVAFYGKYTDLSCSWDAHEVRIYTAAADGSAVKLVAGPFDGPVSGLSWSADGNRLSFVAPVDGCEYMMGGSTDESYTVEVPGADPLGPLRAIESALAAKRPQLTSFHGRRNLTIALTRLRAALDADAWTATGAPRNNDGAAHALSLIGDGMRRLSSRRTELADLVRAERDDLVRLMRGWASDRIDAYAAAGGEAWKLRKARGYYRDAGNIYPADPQATVAAFGRYFRSWTRLLSS